MTTTKLLSGMLGRVIRELPEEARPLHIERTPSGYFLYARGGAKELLFGKTKDDLYERMAAMLLGARIARGEEQL
jgi:hypothetical protein